MKRTLTLVAMALALQATAGGPEGTAFDLDDPAQVRETMTRFVQSLKDKDFNQEKKFRSEHLMWWYKSIDNEGKDIPQDSSLAYIGFLDSLKMADELQIDTENRLIMRTFYVEPDNAENKHRYAFYIDEEGKIGGILYVPPLTTEYFPNWTEDDFKFLAENLEETISMGYMDMMWGDINFAGYGCGGVLPLVQDLEALAKEENPEETNQPEAEKEIAEVDVVLPSDVPYRRALN